MTINKKLNVANIFIALNVNDLDNITFNLQPLLQG